jgi:hypothetical protein
MKPIKVSLLTVTLGLLSLGSGVSRAAEPVIDNERITVWDATRALPPAQHDFVAIPFSRKGTAVFGRKGDTPPGENGPRTVVIELKDHVLAPIPNETGLPLAFPRPHAKKLLENERVIVWDYAWRPGEPTPMHFHDKDAIAVYETGGSLQSTTPDGQSVVKEVKLGTVTFNPRERSHSEILVSGHPRAVIIELK